MYIYITKTCNWHRSNNNKNPSLVISESHLSHPGVAHHHVIPDGVSFLVAVTQGATQFPGKLSAVNRLTVAK